MNYMRKILGSSSGSFASTSVDGEATSSASPGVSADSAAPSQPSSEPAEQELLGLTHLNKLFAEFQKRRTSKRSGSIGGSLDEDDEEGQLYAMLPLFCKVFSSTSNSNSAGHSTPRSIVTDKFHDAKSFAHLTSKLLVTEVRRRASNQSTQEAAEAIASYMEIDSGGGGKDDTNNSGWLLLSVLNTLLEEGEAMAQVMTLAAVPSTLVKCLYLFFDLPRLQSDEQKSDDNDGGEDEFSPRERRRLLQKMFIQVLLRLSGYVPAVEELAKKDDLTLLFSAVTSTCPEYNLMWRKTSADILLTISRHSLSPSVITYLHNKGCISLCVSNMSKSNDLTPLEIVEMFVTVFCFLKDSSKDSQTLLDDFRTCQGYTFLTEFVLRLEKEVKDIGEGSAGDDATTEANEAIRNLVLLIASLSFLGYTELPSSTVSDVASISLFQLNSFELPQPENRGSTVRNLLAFQVLQSVFTKATSQQLGSVIMDAISTIFTADNANYFLLEGQHALPQFAERIYSKPDKVQEKFFQLVEFLVHHLKFVPCKELISLSLIIKGHSENHPDCCNLAIQSLVSFIKLDPAFKDVYRNLGMIEVLTGVLNLHLRQITEATSTSNQALLGEHVLGILTELLEGNGLNAGVFRDTGGLDTVLSLCRFDDAKTRAAALTLFQQMVIAGGNDKDMTALLELIHRFRDDYKVQNQVLHAVITCLRESHKSRTVFRKVGGFVHVVSVLVSLEGCLAHDAKVDDRDVYTLLQSVFVCLAVAMRYEPANGYHFQTEIAGADAGNFVATIRNLGCFNSAGEEAAAAAVGQSIRTHLRDRPVEAVTDAFNSAFYSSPPFSYQSHVDSSNCHKLSQTLYSSTVVMRLLYDMALDNYDNKGKSGRSRNLSQASRPSPAAAQLSGSISSEDSLTDDKRRSTSSSGGGGGGGCVGGPTWLDLSPVKPEPTIVHPSIVIIMLKLLPHAYFDDEEADSAGLQLFVAEVIRSLLRQEKNQQIMCDLGLMSEIMTMCSAVLEDEAHILHSTFQYLLERLAAQKLEASDLRTFFRLGNPLSCLSDDQWEQYLKSGSHRRATSCTPPGGFLPLTRIKTLVSMTTPRDTVQNNSILPPFIEFDMAPEGFGCLYLPSLAPSSPTPSQSTVVSSLASMESAGGGVVGGIGTGDRPFPPTPGLSYSTWFCIDKFSDPRTDPHPVRLLTLARTVKVGTSEDHIQCLAVCLSARDKAFIVSVQETPLARAGTDWQPDFTGENGVRVWFPDLIKEGEWHHLVIVLNRQVIKNSSFSLYVNGQHISTQRMFYISQNPGGGAANLALATSVYGFIGTPPMWRRSSRLSWKQGPCLLYEDLTSPQLASLLHQLGPHYLGSLQAPQAPHNSATQSSQVAEERMVFGLNAVAVTTLTMAKIRKVYSKVDTRSIAKQLGGMATGENATPIRVVHNAAGHLLGPSRCLGGVIVGYLGVRVFTPQPVSKVIETVGGCNVLLGIIAMANDMESLYAGVKSLVCVLKSNPFAHYEMEGLKGYQTLGMLLRKKLPLLNAHILHLMFTMAGTLDVAATAALMTSTNKECVGQHQQGIPNVSAFRDVLCDLELWNGAPPGVEKSLFEHFFELVASDNNSRNLNNNTRRLRDFSLVDKLLGIVKKPNYRLEKSETLFSVIHGLLSTSPRVTDVLSFALFTATTLSSTRDMDEKQVQLPSSLGKEDSTSSESIRNILLRNKCLSLFLSLLYTDQEQCHIHTTYCEDVVQVVGFDWIMLFLQGHCHQTTVVWALRILMTLLSQHTLLVKFRSGTCNGNWLLKSEIVLQNKMVKALGQQNGTSKVASSSKIRHDIFTVPGFQLFNWLMPYHIRIPEVYYLLMAMTMGQVPKKSLPVGSTKMDLDSVWVYIFGTSPSATSPSDLTGSAVSLSADTMITILTMVRAILNNKDDDNRLVAEYPVTLTQFLFYLYHNLVDFAPFFMTNEVLTALAGTLFPIVPPQLAEEEEEAEPGTTDDSLNQHPAKRNVMNFIRVLIVDALSLPVSNNPKSPPIIDLLLDAQPVDSTGGQQCRYQTELLGIVMDHLLAADILIGDGAALPIVPGGSSQFIAPNVFYLASRLVDKMWQGVIKKDPEEVLTFVLRLIAQAKRRGSDCGSLNLEGIYRSLNRTILYMLSGRPSDGSVASQMTVLDVLHKIVTERSIVFGAGNHELEFFACLTYCLMRLQAGKSIEVGSPSKEEEEAEDELDFDDSEAVSRHQGQNLLSNASARVWDLMYAAKKPALEEVFKCSFGASNNVTPTLASIRPNLMDTARKAWLAYLETERKLTSAKIPAWEFHTSQLESRIQRITGGITGGLKRLTSVSSSASAVAAATSGGSNNSSSGLSKASSSASKKDADTLRSLPKVEKSLLSQTEVESATLDHICIVREVVEQSHKNRLHTEQHMLKYLEEEWLSTESQLTQERGLWGPARESPLTKWMLDMTEGPVRMRKKMVRNGAFYANYPYKPTSESSSTAPSEVVHSKYKRPSSADSKTWYEKHRTIAMFERTSEEVDRVVVTEYDDCDVTVSTTNGDTIDEQIRKIGFQGLKRALVTQVEADTDTETEAAATSDPDDGSEPTSPTAAVEQQPQQLQLTEGSSSGDYQTVMRLLENGEKISVMYRCARIQGLDTAEGLLLFGKDHLYILDGFTLVNGREVHDIDLMPSNYYEPIIPVVPGQVNRLVHKREVIKISYDTIKEVHLRRYLLQPIAVEAFCLDGRNQFLAFIKDQRSKAYQKFLAVATSTVSDSAMLSVAGQKRTANVEQPTGLLSTLMGETSVTQRWVRGEITNFQYLMALNTLAGRSYDDLMQYPVFPWVISDYTSEELDLGNPATFRDLSRPMGAQSQQRLDQFKKRYAEWEDPQLDTSPYFYGTHYSSAMIVTSYMVRLEPFTQHFLHLQGGHFDLPDRMFHSVEDAWDSASRNNMADLRELIPEFFYLPDFLSNRNKFDLGTKQNGETLDDVVLPPWAKGSPDEFIRCNRAALESDYVSAHLHEWIDLIFGHKQQGQAAVEAVNVFHPLFYEGNVDIFSIEDPLQRNATIGFINNFGQIPKQLFKKPHPAKKVTPGGGGVGGTPNASGDASASVPSKQVFFHHLSNMRPSMSPVKELKGPVGQIQESKGFLYAVEQNKVLVPGNANRYLAWGYADQSFRLGNYDSDKAVFICEPNYLIGQVLTCVCPNSKVVLTAGTSSVVAVYEYNKVIRQLLIKKLLYGHTDAVTCLAASSAWNVAVSGSRDRTAILWDLSRYQYVKTLDGHAGPVAATAVDELTGNIITAAGSWLYLWTVNGAKIACVNTLPATPPSPSSPSSAHQILCVCASQFQEWDRENVVMTGSSDGVVRMWSLDYVEVPTTLEGVTTDTAAVADVEAVTAQQTAALHRLAEKKKSLVVEADCLDSLREVIANTNRNDDEASDDEDEQNGGGEEEEEEDATAHYSNRENSSSSSDTEEAGDVPDDSQDKMTPAAATEAAEVPAAAGNPSSNDDFVLIHDHEVIGEGRRGLRRKGSDGYAWVRQLVFRAKLTMHTAFERADNASPAAVTALAVSKDHKTVYVGDEKGRVFSWTVSGRASGKGMVDHWVKDEAAESCLDCKVKFTFMERKHHCRNCGGVFCSSCSQYKKEIPRMKIHQPVRVCKSCLQTLNSE